MDKIKVLNPETGELIEAESFRDAAQMGVALADTVAEMLRPKRKAGNPEKFETELARYLVYKFRHVAGMSIAETQAAMREYPKSKENTYGKHYSLSAIKKLYREAQQAVSRDPQWLRRVEDEQMRLLSREAMKFGIDLGHPEMLPAIRAAVEDNFTRALSHVQKSKKTALMKMPTNGNVN